MFAIQLLYKTGGSKSLRAPTIAAVKLLAADVKPSEFIGYTIPYAVYKCPEYSNTYDVSIPFEIMQGLGVELRLLYNSGNE